MKIGFVGTGQMARALAMGIHAQHSESIEIFGSDPSPAAIECFRTGVPTATVLDTNKHVFEQAEIVFLAVKPQMLDSAVEGVNLSDHETVVVSVMAGVTSSQLAKLLKTNQVIRTMPNTPCLVGAGAIAVSQNQFVSPEMRETIARLLSCVGEVTLVDESHLDAVTGLSGSGPAYVLEFIESLTDGGVLAGLSRDVAARLALQTVYGTACMLQQTGLHPAQLKDQVTSPGGTTIHGLVQLHTHAFRGAVAEAVMAAAERSAELGKHR